MTTLHLRTFGGLTLQQEGENITGLPTQRRQLALLALLAVAGDEGMSREKLLGYLWPERDSERARHTLNQVLYTQRRVSDNPEVFLGKKTLRLDPELIDSDVRVFTSALAAGNPLQAVEVYRGPFADGFFLDEAPTFEEWVSDWRQRFARQYLGALDALAVAAEGDLDAAIEWRRRAALVDPLDPRLVRAYAEAILRTGNRPGALRVLQAHRERLWGELKIQPEPDLRELEERLRG